MGDRDDVEGQAAASAEGPTGTTSLNPFLEELRKLVNGEYLKKLQRGESLTQEEKENTKLLMELDMQCRPARRTRKRRTPAENEAEHSKARQRVVSRITSPEDIKEFKGVDILRRTFFQFLSFYSHTFDVEQVGPS